jgi:hypothetical protein
MLHRVVLVGSLAEKRAALGDDVGQWRITVAGTVVKDGASFSSANRGRLEEGQLVEVIEVAHLPAENRVRAKVRYGGQKGWISLRSLCGELVWARRADPGEPPGSDVPTYWENWRPHGGTTPRDFEEVFQVLPVDLAVVQGIFDDWADRLSVSEPSRLRVHRVDRNENSRAWRRYASGQATLCTSRASGTSSNQGFGADRSSGSGAGPRQDLPDYRSRFPTAMLNTSVNETYLFRPCEFYQVPQVCSDGFVTDVASPSPFMRLSESPYDVDGGNDSEHSRAVIGRGQRLVSSPTCDEVLLTPFDAIGWYDTDGSGARDDDGRSQ